MAMPNAKKFSALMDGVCETLDLNPSTVSRIILDLDCNAVVKPVMAYVELVVTDKILKFDWSKHSSKIEIKVIDK